MKKILISEDDRNLANTLEEVLKNENFDVRVSYDGVSTLKLLRNFRPDLVIIDLITPIVDGHHISKRIVEDPLYHPIPKMVVITVRTDEWSKKLSEFVGVDAFITKPFNVKDLVKKVKELLNV